MRLKQIKGAAIAVGALLSVAVGASMAQAASLQWQITNNFGSTITLDTASCSSGSSISPPFSIANGSTATVNVNSTGSSELCNIRYQSGVYGCQFQVQASASGGFASANAYKGSGGSPKCPYSDTAIPGGRRGTFSFTR